LQSIGDFTRCSCHLPSIWAEKLAQMINFVHDSSGLMTVTFRICTRLRPLIAIIASFYLVQFTSARRISFTQFFLIPDSDLHCRYDEAQSDFFLETSELIRASAEDCLRKYVPTYCTDFKLPDYIGLRESECIEDTEATIHVTIRGGMFEVDDEDYVVSSSMIENCVKTVLGSNDCLSFCKMTLDEAFSKSSATISIPQLNDLEVKFEDVSPTGGVSFPSFAPSGISFDNIESSLVENDSNADSVKKDDNSQRFAISFAASGFIVAIAITSFFAMHRRRGNDSKLAEELSCNATRSLDDLEADIRVLADIQESDVKDQNKRAEVQMNCDKDSLLDATVRDTSESPRIGNPDHNIKNTFTECCKNELCFTRDTQANCNLTENSVTSEAGNMLDMSKISTESIERRLAALDHYGHEINSETNLTHCEISDTSNVAQLPDSTFTNLFSGVETGRFTGEIMSDFEQDNTWDPDDNSLSTTDSTYVSLNQGNEDGERNKPLLLGNVRSDDESLSDDEILDIEQNANVNCRELVRNESASSLGHEPLIRSFFGQTQRLQMEPLPIPPELKDCKRQRKSTTARVLLTPKGFI
jgi:hypothetical protein